MDTIQYESKMLELLNDETTYEIVKSNPTNTYQKRNNDLIKSWENKNLISPFTAKTLKIHNSQCPKIYGLPKLNKINVPLRPIVSCIQSPFYNLSKYLANILKNVINQNEYYIKNSFEFKHFINSVKLKNNEKLVSLDIKSMYTVHQHSS